MSESERRRKAIIRHRVKKARLAKDVKTMRKEGQTNMEISEKLGIPESSVRHIGTAE